MIKLYDFPRCPFCRKVRITLLEKEIEYQNIFVDLNKKEQKKPEFLKLNPIGKVPVLVDGDNIIYESSVINEYIEETFPEPPLLPYDSFKKARARMLVEYCEKYIHQYVFNIYKEMKLKKGSVVNSEKIRINKKLLYKQLEFLNSILSKGNDYIVGEFSLADIAFMPRMLILESLGIEVTKDLSNVSKWIDKLMSRKSSEIVLG